MEKEEEGDMEEVEGEEYVVEDEEADLQKVATGRGKFSGSGEI